MWPDSEQTHQLLRQAGEGDAGAIEALMDRHRAALRRMVEMRLDRALAQRVDASDVVQDVLLEANVRLHDYLAEPAMPFHLWLRALARDRIVDMHRRHRQAQRRSVDREQATRARRQDAGSSRDLLNELADPELTPAAANIRRELVQQFLEALEAMSEDDRDVLVMRHCEGLSNSDVAQMLGLSQPAAGMRYLRALRRLRSLLGEREQEGNEA